MVNQKETIFGRFFEKQRKTERRRKKKEIKRVHEGKPLTGVEEKKMMRLEQSQAEKKIKKKEKELKQEEVDLNDYIFNKIDFINQLFLSNVGKSLGS